MIKSVNQLEEVELIEEKPFIVQGIDRKVFNVDQDLTSTGSTALELMEKLPSVEVDIDGNLSLRGSTQVRLYWTSEELPLSSMNMVLNKGLAKGIKHLLSMASQVHTKLFQAFYCNI